MRFFTPRLALSRLLVAFWAAAAIAVMAPRTSLAVDLYWSGTGDWNTTNVNWGDAPSGPYDTDAWGATAENDAVFEGTAGTVTLTTTNPSARSLTFSATDYILSGGTLTFGGSGGVGLIGTGVHNATINSIIAGSVGMTKTGTGSLTLTGANTYTGPTAISAGVLRITHATSMGNISGAATVADGATLLMDGTDGVVFVGDKGLTISGTGAAGQLGALVSTGGNSPLITNRYNGNITLADDATIASIGGRLNLTRGITTAGHNVTLQAEGGSMVFGTVNGQITGTGGLIKTGSLGVSLNVGGAGNSYSGGTTILEGSITTSSNNQLGSGFVLVDGGTALLNLNVSSHTVGTVTIDDGGQINGTTGVLTSTGSFEMRHGSASAILSGAGIALNKTTANTVTLTGANTYTGNTNVQAGNLVLGLNGSITSDTFVADGATLSGIGLITGSLTVDQGGALAPGNSPGIISLDGDLTIDGIYTVAMDGPVRGTGYASTDVLGANRVVTIDDTTSFLDLEFSVAPSVDGMYWLIVNDDATSTVSGEFAGWADGQSVSLASYGYSDLLGTVYYSGDFDTNSTTGGNSIVLHVVPEPSAVGLLAAALTCCIVARRRRTAA